MKTSKQNLSPSYRHGRPPKLIKEIIYKIHVDYLNGKEPDTLLPTQQELAETYGVSRATIRSAFDTLEYRKVIIRNSTVGTYVAHPPNPVEAPFSQKEVAVSFANSYRMLEAGTFPTLVISGVLNELTRNDMHLTLFSSDWRWEKNNPPARPLAPPQFVGCILIGKQPQKVIDHRINANIK